MGKVRVTITKLEDGTYQGRSSYSHEIIVRAERIVEEFNKGE